MVSHLNRRKIPITNRINLESNKAFRYNYHNTALLMGIQIAGLLNSKEMSENIENQVEHAERLASFNAAFLPYFDKIRAFCILKTGSKEQGEDLAQEVIVKAFKGWDNFEDQGSGIMPWVNKIINNTYINQNIKEDRHVTNREGVRIQEDGAVDFGLDRSEKVKTGLSAESAYLDKEGEEFINQAIEELGPAFSEVVRLNVVDGMSYKEIAEFTGINSSTVGTKIHRGREMLREKLAERAKDFGIEPDADDKKKK